MARSLSAGWTFGLLLAAAACCVAQQTTPERLAKAFEEAQRQLIACMNMVSAAKEGKVDPATDLQVSPAALESARAAFATLERMRAQPVTGPRFFDLADAADGQLTAFRAKAGTLGDALLASQLGWQFYTQVQDRRRMAPEAQAAATRAEATCAEDLRQNLATGKLTAGDKCLLATKAANQALQGQGQQAGGTNGR
jgi:hypothetical protein